MQKRCLRKHLSQLQSQSQSHRLAFSDNAALKWVRDRGLDHAVEREKNLKPLLAIKNLIKSEPSKSLPITIITQERDSLEIPIRPIDFVRKYPSIFQEFLPGNIGVHPHVKLTPEVLNLDAEEQLVFQSDTYKQLVADRLLKLLMISRINRIPLDVLDMLKWDLGLPQDYVNTVVPEFPDYFRVVGTDKRDSLSGLDEVGELELVCWSDELAVSVMEKKATYGQTIVFSSNCPTGFEMDKKMKKWLDNWQKLPYISPYVNATHLLPKSDESDKWVVSVLHELLSLFGAKKVEREKLLRLGEYLGIRSRFKRALLHHPSIFYVSSKMGKYTVVLREAYKRGSLIKTDVLMNVRNQYIHLMHMVKEEPKVISGQSESKQKEKEMPLESKGEEEDVDDGNEEENDVEAYDISISEEEDTSHDDSEDFNDEEDNNRKGACKDFGSRGRRTRNMNLDVKGVLGNPGRGTLTGRHLGQTKEKVSPNHSRRREMQGEDTIHINSGKRLNFRRSKRILTTEKKNPPNHSWRREMQGEDNVHRNQERG